ncbi:MAG: response regulator [Candidatus Riflebacteria bacterium]|nr:response regulator [Candidatus Riflebacteria bacterium]
MTESVIREITPPITPQNEDVSEVESSHEPFKLWNEEKQCILAVDDMPENIEIIRNLLGKEYQIKAATKGSKAIEIARRHPQPDLILLDIMMPEMSGLEVCRILKTDADTLHIPIIFATGKTDGANEIEGFEFGAADYITKPFHPAIIKARVQTHLMLLKEQKKVDQLLENVLPRRIIQNLKSSGFSAPELFEPVTLMLAEMIELDSGKTNFTEQMAEELTDMFTVMDGIVARRGAERIKTFNNSYLAASGLPVPNIDHARIMVQVAVDFMNFLNFSSLSRKKGWKVRIGLHSGSVVGSIIGRKHYHYDVFGDAVKIATLVRDSTPAMSLLVTETTMQLVKNSFSFVPHKTINFKENVAVSLYELARNNRQMLLD